ncbi:MAG: hypothetical protein RLZZ605_202, partial [Bacteroidota bacterium]
MYLVYFCDMKSKELFDGTIVSQYSYFYVMNYCEEV